MIDIVVRLRAEDGWVCNEGADEIERLRAAHREIVALAPGSQGAYGKFARAQKISGDALKDTTPSKGIDHDV